MSRCGAIAARLYPSPDDRAAARPALAGAAIAGIPRAARIRTGCRARAVAGRAELSELDVDVDLYGAEELMFSLCAGEMWASTSSSTRRPAERIDSTARPWYSVLQATTALVTRVRHHACSELVATISAADADGLDEASLHEHLLSWLPRYKVPRRVTVVRDWPMTASGKVSKNILRRSVGNGSDQIVRTIDWRSRRSSM